jgi:hypothetical protein
MEAIDITSEGLRQQGYTLKKEGPTIALYHNGSCHRCSFYKDDWNRTTNRLDEKLAEQGIDRLVIQTVKADMSRNFDKLMTNGSASAAAARLANSAIAEKQPEKLDDMDPLKWFQELEIRYEKLQNIIQNSSMPLPQLMLPLEFALSVKNILNLADNTLPFAGFLLGAPSSLKTVTVELFRTYWHSVYRDDFSPKAFVSHYSGLPEEDLQKIDLLPNIQHKLFLTPELAPLFTGSEDDILKAFGLLTRLLDGRGLETHSGTQGRRGYHGDYMFTWFGAVVDISQRVHRMMGNLGPKMYFLRLPKSYHKEKDLIQQIKDPKFLEDKAKIEAALMEYLKWFEASPTMNAKNGLPKEEWDETLSEPNTIKYIARLAELIGPLRGVAEVQDTEDTYGSSYGYSNTIIEEPWRANQQLYNLARGHAMIHGRNFVTMTDIPMLIKVVLSTAPIARVAVFELLLAHKGTLKTADIENALGISPHTVRKTMTEFELLGLVDMKKEGEYDNSALEITLKSRFRWCLGSRFRQLREGFSPTRKPRKHGLLGKRSSNQGDNVKKESTKQAKISGEGIDNFPSSFWVYYNELEKQEESWF